MEGVHSLHVSLCLLLLGAAELRSLQKSSLFYKERDSLLWELVWLFISACGE